MNFKFDVTLTDTDYYDFNKFWMLYSHYGKKNMLSIRLTAVGIVVILALLYLFGNGFSAEGITGVIPMLLVLAIFELGLTPFMQFFLKQQIKSMHKTGKMPYSPSAVVEFNESTFSETTPLNKTVHLYSAIERISVINNKIIYIHVNNIMAYLLPYSSFSNREEYEKLLAFLKEKCKNVDFYF